MTYLPDSASKPTVPWHAVAQVAVGGFILVFVLAGYTVLHEGGHALTGLLFGGTITAFDVSFWDLTAHVGLEGEFTPAQLAIISVMGAGLPYPVFAVLVGLAPRRLNPVLSWLRMVGSLAVINSLLAWVVLPLLSTQVQVAGDDSLNFLNYTQANPLLVSSVTLAAYVGGWLILLRRVGSPRALVDDLRQEAPTLFAPGSLASLRALAAVFVVGTALVGGVSLYLSATNPLALPPGYTLVRAVDLSERGYADEVVYRFTLEQDGIVSLHFLLQDVTSGPMVIEMKGSDGYDAAFLRLGAGSGIGRATVRPQGLELRKGDYEIRFTFPQAPGRVAIAVKMGT